MWSVHPLSSPCSLRFLILEFCDEAECKTLQLSAVHWMHNVSSLLSYSFATFLLVVVVKAFFQLSLLLAIFGVGSLLQSLVVVVVEMFFQLYLLLVIFGLGLLLQSMVPCSLRFLVLVCCCNQWLLQLLKCSSNFPSSWQF